jgi:hypothetical protein
VHRIEEFKMQKLIPSNNGPTSNFASDKTQNENATDTSADMIKQNMSWYRVFVWQHTKYDPELSEDN